MGKEIAISLYLFVFRILFNFFKQFPLKTKTVCVATFGDNIFYTTQSISDISNEKMVILKSGSCKHPFYHSKATIISFSLKRPIAYIQSIYHLATAKTIIVDNYYGFLAATAFKEEVTCVQVWHAAGAIKKFGLKDPTNKYRAKKANKRFQKVYNSFDYTVVGSERMAETFKESFGLTDDRILRTGIPRSDVLFDDSTRDRIYNQLTEKHPLINNRKIILYAPTFRSNQLNDYQIQLDLEKLYQEISDDYVLLIKPHPAVTFEISEAFQDFVYNVSEFYDTNQLLLITDILITDYSSIPFEFALLEKPMIFFAYDLEEYRITSGLIDNYEDQMPGPIADSTEAVILAIKEDNFNYEQIKEFAKQWNEYSNGTASLNLAKYLTNTELKEREKAII
ncbi:CDP-glycerol glycerophosphotransferase family protein [Virgibacillus dokdonensis]|uniref:CDP-glycerol glycerophosphotransferase family protein n=1 Tax=Virgibacillus dokdonensis TaxID=302167 RepID=UPI000989CE8A|nr:CDP-glycerol glycerophosphotransferase family protein [Virgibacillus dokdonensis]